MTAATITTGGANLFDCSGRIAVITGPAGLLGPIWTQTLLRAGASVILVAEPGTHESANLLEMAAEPKVSVLTADINSPEQLSSARDTILSRYGAPHVLVASAGVDHPPSAVSSVDLAHLAPADVERITNTNVIGTMLTISAFGAPMADAGRGSIVLIGSQYAAVSPRPQFYEHLSQDKPFVKNPAYGASKAAIVNMGRYFAIHWAPRGVRVNVLSPSGVRARQDPAFQRKFSAEVPLGRMLDPAELEGPLLFLASDASTYVTASHLVVDGGYSAW